MKTSWVYREVLVVTGESYPELRSRAWDGYFRLTHQAKWEVQERQEW